MIAFINRNADLFTFKGHLMIILIASMILGFNWVIFRATEMSQVVWAGECSVSASKETAYANCVMADGKKITDSIRVSLLYHVLVDHKPLMCTVSVNDNLRCSIE